VLIWPLKVLGTGFGSSTISARYPEARDMLLDFSERLFLLLSRLSLSLLFFSDW
jgi:hypothetical protein